MPRQTGISMVMYQGPRGAIRVPLIEFGDYVAIPVTTINFLAGNQNDSRKFPGSRRVYGNRGNGQSWMRVAGLDFIREAAERKRSLDRQSELRRFVAWCQKQGVSASLWPEAGPEVDLAAVETPHGEEVFPYWVCC